MVKSEPKQIIVVRKDLNMRKGKIVAQSCHASLGAILNYTGKSFEGQLQLNIEKPAVREWLEGRFTKICVSVDSEQELLDIYNAALNAGVNVKLITDAGLTEFNGVPTLTCLAIGPDYSENIDPITKHLRLL
jgi:PTH2 family peptidyl-tRNA hydrolase